MQYVNNKKQILVALGSKWFPNTPVDERESRAKALIHRLDMSGTLYGFFRQHGVLINQQTWVNQTETIRLREGEGRFHTYAYIAMQEERTKWLAENRPRLHDLVKASGERAKPHATLRSYMMQEVEWVGREAKKRWANWEGHTWFSNQHDGLGVGFHDGVTHAQAETELTRAVSRALPSV